MQDVMHDLETLGNSAGCVVFSIGAVAFDPETGEMGEEFYSVINVSSCVVLGLRYDQDTLDFWGKQSPEAREALKRAYRHDAPPLRDVLHAFSRCYRTLKNLYPEVPLTKRTGTHHNALDDAKTQAVHALQIFAARRPKPGMTATVAPVAEDDLIG